MLAHGFVGQPIPFRSGKQAVGINAIPEALKESRPRRGRCGRAILDLTPASVPAALADPRHHCALSGGERRTFGVLHGVYGKQAHRALSSLLSTYV